METSISGLAVASNSANPSLSNLRTYCIAQRWASGTGGGSERVVDELASHLPGLGVNLSGVRAASTAQDGAYRQIDVYSEVLQKIQADYVTDPNITEVTNGALREALKIAVGEFS